jgi:hypothetical protein
LLDFAININSGWVVKQDALVLLGRIKEKEMSNDSMKY